MLYTCFIHGRRSKRRVRRLCMLALAALGSGICSGQAASEYLARAEHLADVGNWFAAAPFYSKAEAEFRSSGDLRNELYAKIGRLHKDVQQGAYRRVRDELERDLTKPLVQGDPTLKIRALALMGLIDLNINTKA